MLEHNQRPARSAQLLDINIIRCTLQVLHIKFPIHYLLFALEHTDVERVGAGNPVALAVENLNGEINVTVVTDVALSIDHEFLPDVAHRFVDGNTEHFKTQVNTIDADFAPLPVEDGHDITAKHAAVDGVVVIQISQVAVVATL